MPKTAKLKMMQGLPASGKSTKARELVASGNFYRLNRDDLRASLYAGSKWSPQREQEIIAVQRAAAKELLSRKQSVVIDDTNLNPWIVESWKAIAREIPNVEFEMVVVPTPVEECVRRDALRKDGHVGSPVIYRMALEYGWIDKYGKPFVIVDVDGTLANGEHRNHLLLDKTDPDRWEKYFSEVYRDTPYPVVVNWVRALQEDYRIVIVSGRPDSFSLENMEDPWEPWTMAQETSSFIRRECGIEYTALLMRGKGDKRPDTQVKQDIYNKCLKDKEVAFVLDDRPSVCKMWRANNLTCYPVRGAIEDF